MDGWRYDFGSFRSGLGLPSHKLCGDPTDMDKRGDAPAQEGHAGQRVGGVATRLGLPPRTSWAWDTVDGCGQLSLCLLRLALVS